MQHVKSTNHSNFHHHQYNNYYNTNYHKHCYFHYVNHSGFVLK